MDESMQNLILEHKLHTLNRINIKCIRKFKWYEDIVDNQYRLMRYIGQINA